jgi:hypothetical protein
MRTTQEITALLERIKQGEVRDVFGTRMSDLVRSLEYDAAKPYLGVKVTREDWQQTALLTDELVIARMLEFMPYAWNNANNHRALPAVRSIEHMEIWLWLLGYESTDKLFDVYHNYGKTCLRAICEKFGWDWRQWDDGKWRSGENGHRITEPPETIEYEWSK